MSPPCRTGAAPGATRAGQLPPPGRPGPGAGQRTARKRAHHSPGAPLDPHLPNITRIRRLRAEGWRVGCVNGRATYQPARQASAARRRSLYSRSERRIFRAGSSGLVRQPTAERRVQQPDVQGILPPAPLIAARYARSRRAAGLYAAGPGSRAPMARGRPWALRRTPAWPVPQRIGIRHASGPPAKAAGSGSRAAPMITLSSSYEPARATAGHVPGAAPRQAVLEAVGDVRRHRRGDAQPG